MRLKSFWWVALQLGMSMFCAPKTQTKWVMDDGGLKIFDSPGKNAKIILIAAQNSAVRVHIQDEKPVCQTPEEGKAFCRVSYSNMDGWFADAYLLSDSALLLRYNKISFLHDGKLVKPGTQLYVAPIETGFDRAGTEKKRVSYALGGSIGHLWLPLLSERKDDRKPIMRRMPVNNRETLHGRYVVRTYPEGTPSEINFIDSNRFSVIFNQCGQMGEWSGSYRIKGHNAFLKIDPPYLSHLPEIITEILDKNEILFLTDTHMCNPNAGDIFRRQ